MQIKVTPFCSIACSKLINGAFKFLEACQDTRVRSMILARAPDKVLNTICTAALKIERAAFLLKKKQKAEFKKHKNLMPS